MEKILINNVSPTTEQAIKRKSAYGLPDRPSESGMRSGEIKKAFYASITDKGDSVLSELKRVVGEVNNVLDKIYTILDDDSALGGKVDVDQKIENANKVMVTNEVGEVTPSNVITLGDCKCYSENDDNGESSFVIEFGSKGE